MIDFLIRADSLEAFESMAKSQGFMDEDGHPVGECIFDPTYGTPEYATGIPITPLPETVVRKTLPDGKMSVETVTTDPALLPPPGYYLNFRVWGALEAAQTADLQQTREVEGEGGARSVELLPLRERTTFGLNMTELGEDGVQGNGTTTFVTAVGVSFIDPESIATRQRVWQ